MFAQCGPLLIVNSAAIDPVNNDSDYQQLFAEISKKRARPAFLQSRRQQLAAAS